MVNGRGWRTIEPPPKKERERVCDRIARKKLGLSDKWKPLVFECEANQTPFFEGPGAFNDICNPQADLQAPTVTPLILDPLAPIVSEEI